MQSSSHESNPNLEEWRNSEDESVWSPFLRRGVRTTHVTSPASAGAKSLKVEDDRKMQVISFPFLDLSARVRSSVG